MSDTTTGNGPELPEQYKAVVENGLARYQHIVAERDNLLRDVSELRTQIAGYKVALEANDERIIDIDSRMKSAVLERDQAVADLAVYETLFEMFWNQLDTFVPPRKPLSKQIQRRHAEIAAGAGARADAQNREELQKQLAAQASNPNPYFNQLPDKPPSG